MLCRTQPAEIEKSRIGFWERPSDNVSKRVGNFGHNAATEERGDLIECDVIIPKVSRRALQNAISVEWPSPLSVDSLRTANRSVP